MKAKKSRTPTPPNRRPPAGADVLHTPALNKGTAFSPGERRRLGLQGLLPPRVSTMEQQVQRLISNVRRQTNDLQKYVEMIALLDRNETLFYRAVQDHIEELMPIIYTPTVGAACQMHSHIFRRTRGVFITRRDKGSIRNILRNWGDKDVRVIVVTDGERILGLGDLGADGMGIPIGKLSLYTACAGVHPQQTLPVMLDVGTNNESLRGDPLYLGVPERRITGKEYDELVDEFVEAVQEVFPKAMLQFEDFANHNAFRLLAKYRGRICAFNDDIQGTAAVTLAGLLSTARVTGIPLKEMKILFHGAGEAAIGIADLIVLAMTAEGMTKAEAMSRCWFMDSKALVQSAREDLQEHKKPYAHAHPAVGTLAEAVRALKPTALIGVSGMAKQFTREIIEDMARLNERPVIFALSNPTSKSECSAEEAYTWSDGRALFATGSPFEPFTHKGKTFVTGQSNNAYIFPGVGLGVAACGARRVTDAMFLESAKALSGLVTDADLNSGCLFPSLTKIREVSAHIAAAVIEEAGRSGLASEPRPKDAYAFAKSRQYKPVYREF